MGLRLMWTHPPRRSLSLSIPKWSVSSAALPKLVGDVAAWRSQFSDRLERVSTAFRQVSAVEAAGLDSLAVEEGCVWIGPDSLRPSLRAETTALSSWLDSSANRSSPGMRLAAIVLGQRRVPSDPPKDFADCARGSRQLFRWPPDLVSLVLRDEQMMQN